MGKYQMNKVVGIICTALVVLLAIQSVSFASEAERNKKINSDCEAKAMQYNDGDVQTSSHCQQATKNKCLADALGDLYPDAKGQWQSRVSDSCQILRQMGDSKCPACQ